MHTDIYSELHEADIYPYGSNELESFSKQLTRYFSREYEQNKNNDKHSVILNQGPLALAHELLAENHYNEGVEFFQTFLDKETMSYTMAYFDEDPDKVLESKKPLHEAQLDKFRLITHRMRLKGNEKLLNLGCGFGLFESYLLNTYPDLKIMSITHSKHQYNFICNRRNAASDILSSDRFDLYFGELNENICPALGSEEYDVVCSVGLLEQINNIELLFDIIHELLNSNGRMFHHLIVSRDLIPQLLDPDKTLIGKYFPGGKVLPFTALEKDFNYFRLEESWFINGMNYWRTLDMWHSNFWRNLDQIYPDIMSKERVRHWNMFFALCKAMFAPDSGYAYGNGQYLYYKA